MAKLVINGIEGFKAQAGNELGVSDWIDVTQDLVNQFADVTGDHQWIHVDPERAKDTPFGGTIAHGLLTLSLGPQLVQNLYSVENVGFSLNYGYGKIRFPSPVPVGSRLRARAVLSSVEDVAGGIQIMITITFEIEGGAKPVCVAEHLVRVYPPA